MDFSSANKAPIGVTIDGATYLLPRVRRKFWIDWAAEVDGQRVAEATRGLGPVKRFQLLSVYPVMPTDSDELARRAFTPAGIDRILAASLAAGGVPAATAKAVLEESPERDKLALALVLASIVDPAQAAAARAEADDESPDGAEKGASDPLPPAGTGSAA